MNHQNIGFDHQHRLTNTFSPRPHWLAMVGSLIESLVGSLVGSLVESLVGSLVGSLVESLVFH